MSTFFSFRRLGGWVSDSLEVYIDGRQVLSTRVGYGIFSQSVFSAHSRTITIDDVTVELLYRWHWLLRGDPAYILLRHGSRVLIKYGSDQSISAVTKTNALSLDEAK